jgi:hypothetical protein
LARWSSERRRLGPASKRVAETEGIEHKGSHLAMMLETVEREQQLSP